LIAKTILLIALCFVFVNTKYKYYSFNIVCIVGPGQKKTAKTFEKIVFAEIHICLR